MREPAASQIIAGKYRLESLIGHGGMGSVWRARHETLDMPVAIKFMAPQALADAESRHRFDREARALAALRTPHIVQVLDHGVDDETPYIVMEFLEGEDLASRLTLRRRLPLEEVSRILGQVARALRRAHEAGITHRDLKPSNIFLARIDDEEVVKVLDFGVAKLAQAGLLADSQLTKAGTLLGSPGYMSPEQARGKEVDFRSDLWALAVIVFRAVTGQKPFAGDSIAELVIKLCIDPRPIPSRFAPDLPPAVDRFFEKAFAGNPEDRFNSAVEMAAAFAAMLGQPAPSLEVSRMGPSPVAGLSRAWLDAPQAPAVRVPSPPGDSPPPAFAPPVPPPPSGNLPAPRLPPSRGPVSVPTPPAMSSTAVAMPYLPQAVSSSGAAMVPRPPSSAAPEGTTVMPFPQRMPAPEAPPPPPPPLLAQATMVLPPLGAAGREPTPTPASFAGFAPSGVEAASAPPGAGGAAPFPLADGSLRAPPTGMQPSVVIAPYSTPAPEAPAMQQRLDRPTIPALSAVRPASRLDMLIARWGFRSPDGTLRAKPQVLIVAAAGAALLAVLLSLAIAAIRRPDAEASSSLPDDVASNDPAPIPSAAPTDTPSAAPSDTPSATASEPPAASADTPEPSVSATASAAPPVVTATHAHPQPTYTAPKPKPTGSTTKPTGSTTKPAGSATTKPKSTSTGKTPPAPTGTTKKPGTTTKPGTRK